MITVYLDESRHDDPDSFTVVAGFYGTKEQWEALIPEWIAGLGNRKSLHMRTLRMHSKSERARRLLNRLGPLPYRHGLMPIHGAVKTADYYDMVNEGQRKQIPGYSICLANIMYALNDKIPGHESIKIVCEIQNRYEENALQLFRSYRIILSHPANPYFSGIEFIPKDSSVLTQPGDFLSFAIAHFFENPQSTKSTLCRPIFGPTGTTLGYTLNRNQIREAIHKTKLIMGERW